MTNCGCKVKWKADVEGAVIAKGDITSYVTVTRCHLHTLADRYKKERDEAREGMMKLSANHVDAAATEFRLSQEKRRYREALEELQQVYHRAHCPKEGHTTQCILAWNALRTDTALKESS